MQKRVVFLTALLCLVSSSCFANKALTDLESGIVQLSVNQQSPSPAIYQKRFQTPFLSVPKIALAVHSFQLIYMDITEWKMQTTSETPLGASFLFHNEKGKWRSIKVGYWANSRTDIFLGQSVANLGSLRGSTKSIVVNFNKTVQNNSKSIIRVYINGIVFNSASGISVRVFDNGLVSSALRVNVEAGPENDIRRVYFSYLIFSPEKSPFSSYGGGLKELNYQNTKVVDIHKIIYDTPYIFYGLMGVKLSSSDPLKFDLNIDEYMYLKFSVSRKITQTIISYIVIGNPSKNLCSGCANLPYAVGNECMNSCPVGTYPFIYPDQGRSCRYCPAHLNYQLNRERNGCVCKSGFSMKNGVCEQSAPQFENFFSPDFSSSFQSFPSTPPVVQTPSQTTFIPPVIPQAPPKVIPTSQPQVPPQIPTQVPTQRPTKMPTQNFPRPSFPTAAKQIGKYTVKDCSSTPNTYWTGYRCACRVGYSEKNGNCVSLDLHSKQQFQKPSQFLYRLSRLYMTLQCGPNEVVEGEICVCCEGYQRAQTGKCEPKELPVQCPPNSQSIHGQCVCLAGYTMVAGKCQQSCPPNSILNLLGQCECITGYQKISGQCVEGTPCPAYSTRNSAGVCVCNAGYKMHNNICSRCDPGQIYVQQQGRCITPCGINEELNPQTKTCQCKGGFGKYQGICSVCPPGYFIKDSYCVLCPIGSNYDSVAGKCVCEEGLEMKGGFCVGKCTKPNQVYDADRKVCRCAKGLGLSPTGDCQICPLGVDSVSFKCLTGCKTNEVLVGSECVCKNGFGFNSAQQCIDCSALSGGFLLEGYCATCPQSYIYNGATCVCPPGSSQNNGQCKASCQEGQLTDVNGICYWCPLNQVILNNQCSCKDGYVRVGKFCEVQCKQDQYVINGRCAFCALNTVYDVQLGSCVCAPGYYKNILGYCEKKAIVPITCSDGEYFQEGAGCLSCPDGCRTCSAANSCTTCMLDGYVPQGNTCVPKCGDGDVAFGLEQCDDGNIANNDGCSSTCKVQNLWACNGEPSVCIRQVTGPICGDGNVEGTEQCDDGNVLNGDGCSFSCQVEAGWNCEGTPSSCIQLPPTPIDRGMKLFKDVLINSNNAFILVQTDKQYTFTSPTEMKSFIQYSFPVEGTQPTSAYCLQQPGNLKVFQCLLIYASGVPNFPYEVDLSYKRDPSDTGRLAVTIDSQAGAFGSRSLL